MSAPLSAGRIVEHALRQIGAYSVNDLGPDPSHTQVGLERLDMLVAELASTEDLPWLVTARIPVLLVAGTSVYPLTGIEHVTAVHSTRETGRLEPVELIRLSQFLLLDTGSGDPEYATVTRDPTLSLNVWPAPAAPQVGITLYVTGQRYAEELLSGKGRDPHGMPEGWARFLVYMLASDLGSGPIHMLAPGIIQGFEQRAASLKGRLMAHSSRGQLGRPRFTRYRDF